MRRDYLGFKAGEHDNQCCSDDDIKGLIDYHATLARRAKERGETDLAAYHFGMCGSLENKKRAQNK